MTRTATDLLEHVLRLPPEEREEFASRLLDALEDPAASTDADFDAELDRRAEELRGDPSAGIPWADLKDMR